MKSNTYFKDSALAALRGNWGKAVLATLVIVVVALFFSSPTIYTSYKLQTFMEGYSYTSVSDMVSLASDPEFADLQRQSNGTSALSLLIEIFLLLPLQVGFVNAFRKLLVKLDTNIVGNTFDFSNYWRKIGGMIWMSLLTFFWSLLFIIPGIVKAFSYAMTPFILDEYPELTPVEAIHRSRMMMKGHKFDLFWLYLSFIGWAILCIPTCGIGFLWLAPYMQTAEAAFYEEVKAEYAVNGGLD
jgi:uncharacterized membrane protein